MKSGQHVPAVLVQGERVGEVKVGVICGRRLWPALLGLVHLSIEGRAMSRRKPSDRRRERSWSWVPRRLGEASHRVHFAHVDHRHLSLTGQPHPWDLELAGLPSPLTVGRLEGGGGG